MAIVRRPLSIVVLVLVTGCADYVGDDIRAGDFARREAIALTEVATEVVDPPPPPERVGSFTLEPGMCFEDLDDTPLRAFGRGGEVGRVGCEYPHRFELFARPLLATAPDEAWPGDAAAEERSDLACLDAFEAFVGSAWAESELDYLYLAPDPARWVAGDARASCALFDLGLVPLDGSMEQSGR